MKKSVIKWIAAGAVAVIGYLYLHSTFIGRYFFQVKRFNIGNKTNGNKIIIILLTDLHFKNNFYSYHSRLAKKINQIHPHLIFITGDVIGAYGKPNPLRIFLDRIHSHIPKVAVRGNHDVKNKISLQTLRKIYQQHNCDLLMNESKEYIISGERLMVTGVDDFIEGDANFKQAVKNVGKEDHHFLLIHSPLQQEKIIEQMHQENIVRTTDRKLNIQYTFAGHNHGGQVRFFGYVPVLPEHSGDYVDGWYNDEPPFLYVSKGFGTAAVPYRIGARPEITVFYYGI